MTGNHAAKTGGKIPFTPNELNKNIIIKNFFESNRFLILYPPSNF